MSSLPTRSVRRPRPEHEQHFLEPRVEVAEEDEARRLLAVSVDDDVIDVDGGEERRDPRLELGGCDGRDRLRDVERRHPHVCQLDRSQHGVSFGSRGILTVSDERRTVGRQVTR